MASRNQQSHAKRARELAVKEKRERKRAKKAETALLRAEGWVYDENGELVPGEGVEVHSELADGEGPEGDAESEPGGTADVSADVAENGMDGATSPTATD